MRRRDDAGAATVLVVALAGVLLLVGLALGEAASLIVDHRRAQAAADLAALAGASSGECAEASRVADRNGARLRACRHDGPDVLVEVEVDGGGWLARTVGLPARARAGPR